MKKTKETIKSIFIILLVVSALSFCGAIFSGCKTKTIHVPVETVRTEYKDKLLRDSIFLHDSILIKMKGDTVWFEKYRYMYRDKLVRDSIFVTDSIQVPYPIKGDTEYINRLYWWQYLLMILGAACIGIIGYKIYSIVKIRN